MKSKPKAALGLVATCSMLCSMSGANGADPSFPLYQWNFNNTDGSNAGTGTAGTLTANVGTGTSTGSFSQTGVSGNAWDHSLNTSNGHDHWWGDQKGNAAAVGDLDLSTVNQFTITMWIKRAGANNNDVLNIGATANPVSASNPGISIGLNGTWDNGMRFGVNGYNAWVGDLWGPGTNSNWVFVAIAYDGTDIENVFENPTMNALYSQNTNAAFITGDQVNPVTVAVGAAVHTGNWSTPAGNVSVGSTATAFLGTDGNTANGFSGNLDDVRIYDGLLTVAEIEAVRQSAFAEPLPDIDLYWKGSDPVANWTSPNWTPDIEGNGTPVALTTGGLGVAFATTGAENLFNQLGADQSVASIVVMPGSGPVDIGGTHDLTIGEGGIWQELTAAELSISTSGAVVVDANQTRKNKSPNPLTVYSSLSGTGTLTKSGTGLLQLSGDNSAHTGGIVVEQGSVSISHANALGGASASLAMNGGTLDLNGFNVTLGALSGNGGAIIRSSTACSLTLDLSADSTYGCSINEVTVFDPVSLIKKGPGNLTSTAGSNFSGPVTIENGQFIANYPNYGGPPTTSSLGNLQVPGRTITVTSPGTLALTNNNIFGNANANPSLLPEIVANATTVSATNYNLIGNITLNGSTLSQSTGNTGNYQGYQFRGSVTVTGTIGFSTITGTGGNHLSSDTIFDVANASGDEFEDLVVGAPLIDRSGDFGSGPGGLTKTGAGTMKLDGVNSYTGATRVLEGVLSMSSATLSDASLVEIAADAVLDLTHSGTDRVTMLRIGTETKPDGIYGALGSGAQFELSQITGSGTIEVVSPYLPWISSFTTLSGASTAKGADPDSDGLTNLEEFALDGNPEDATATGKVRSRVETVGGQQALVITLPVRNGAFFSGTAPATATVEAEGISYEIGGSNELIDFNQNVSAVVPSLAGAPDMPGLTTGWTYRTFRLDGAVGGGTPRGPRGFLRAKVVTEEAP
jgi:autotransporter-associated beta strand protein